MIPTKKIHKRFFLFALRTSLIFMVSFYSYDLLKLFEEKNVGNGNTDPLFNQEYLYHSVKRNTYLFLMMFVFDLLILYVMFFLFREIIV